MYIGQSTTSFFSNQKDRQFFEESRDEIDFAPDLVWAPSKPFACISLVELCLYLSGCSPPFHQLVPGVSALPQRLWWRWLWRPGRFEKLWTEVKKAGGLDFHGGISGLSSALEYFPTLGVDALWITPIFASPMADFGYDISDYMWGVLNLPECRLLIIYGYIMSSIVFCDSPGQSIQFLVRWKTLIQWWQRRRGRYDMICLSWV